MSLSLTRDAVMQFHNNAYIYKFLLTWFKTNRGNPQYGTLQDEYVPFGITF